MKIFKIEKFPKRLLGLTSTYNPTFCLNQNHFTHTRRFCSLNTEKEPLISLKNSEIDTHTKSPAIIPDFIEKNKTPYGNVTSKIVELTQRNIYKVPNHPLRTLALKLEEFYSSPKNHKSDLQKDLGDLPYDFYDNFNPIVSAEDNFDQLLIPKDHVSRKRSDTYYISNDVLLRTHTSAHQNYLLTNKKNAFCVLGDVYRRDEIDATHYPVFHQMEAVRLYTKSQVIENIKKSFEDDSENGLNSLITDPEELDALLQDRNFLLGYIVEDLKQTHENLLKFLLGRSDLEMRWIDAYFPFTEPSFELEVWINGDWVEMLGCGVIHNGVLENGGIDSEENIGWASGIGLERFAMLIYEIPDIRYFWSHDKRFIDQFAEGDLTTKFKNYSKYPSCYKDISFWVLDMNEFEENDFSEVVRSCGGDLIEKVEMIDQFENKKLGKTS